MGLSQFDAIALVGVTREEALGSRHQVLGCGNLGELAGGGQEAVCPDARLSGCPCADGFPNRNDV